MCLLLFLYEEEVYPLSLFTFLVAPRTVRNQVFWFWTTCPWKMMALMWRA